MTTNEIRAKAFAAFEESLAEARLRLGVRDFVGAWPALERAHVLGQPHVTLHVRSHWWMLRCALLEVDVHEVVGQVVRLVLAAPASWLKRYPRGNTGRARVGLFQPMPLPADVEPLVPREPKA